MIEGEQRSLLEAATLEVTSRDLASGAAKIEADVAVHTCASCGVGWGDRYHFDCPECGHKAAPLSRCRSCSGPLRPELVRYVAYGATGGRAIKILPGVSCVTCAVSGVEQHQLATLEALATLQGQDLYFLPEAGIYTAARLEVLAFADVASPGAPDAIARHHAGMSVRVGSPSALFDAALEVVTEQDPANVFSPTLQVTPGPPYTAAQRRDFHRLLAEVQRDLGGPVVCWSAGTGLSDEPPIDPVLLEQLMSWGLDAHGQGLALYHDILADRAPGRLLNSVRLLELVLERQRGEPTAQARREPRVTDSNLELVPSVSLDLAPQLLRSVRAREEPPLGILQRLWLTMRPGLSFDEPAVYGAIAAFAGRYLERRHAEVARLPWEEPDFDGYARELQKLVSALLDPSTR